MKYGRIHKTWEYQTVYREGKKQVGRHVVVYVLFNGREETRFGITVTRKIGKAVIRNRIKRILREIIRKNLREWKNGVDFVLVAKQEIIHASFHNIEQETIGLLQRVTYKAPLPPMQTHSGL